MQTTNLKIEEWRKMGNGPWIVMRLQPSPTMIDAELRLAEIVFRPISGKKIIYTLVSKDAWKRYNGYRAVVIFLLLAANKRAEKLEPNEEIPIISSPLRPSWLNTFSELLQKKKFDNSIWSQNAFGIQTSEKIGDPVENGLARIAKVKGRTDKAIKSQEELKRILHNPNSQKATAFLRISNLNPKNITILVKNSPAEPADQAITNSKELARLAVALENVESKWFKILVESGSNEDLAQPESATLKLATPILREPLGKSSAITAKVSEPPAPSADNTDKSFVDVLRPLPTASIRSHIVAALSSLRGQDTVDRSLAEILSPECINVIAEKLVHETVDAFVDFYASDYDSPPNIKHGVAAVIAANPTLRGELATKVAQSGYWSMLGWLQQFSFFSPREIVTDVEHALIKEIHGNPDFMRQYEWCSLHHLCNLISYFSKFGCDFVVFTFKNLCFEDACRRIRETYKANPNAAEEFADLIGKKEFRSQVEKSLNRKQLTTFQSQLNAIMSAGG